MVNFWDIPYISEIFHKKWDISGKKKILFFLFFLFFKNIHFFFWEIFHIKRILIKYLTWMGYSTNFLYYWDIPQIFHPISQWYRRWIWNSISYYRMGRNPLIPPILSRTSSDLGHGHRLGGVRALLVMWLRGLSPYSVTEW